MKHRIYKQTRFCLLWLLCCCWLTEVIGQVKVVVKDAVTGKPIINAVLMISWHADSTDAWLSDDTGVIAVPLPSNKRLLSASVSCIGYRSIEWNNLTVAILANKAILMQQEDSKLQPVLVRGKRKRLLKAQGDTLSYSVADLTLPGDRNVEAILSRIPGVQIKPDGTILYNEKPIAGLTIDEDDVLGARYALGSRSIKPTDVDTVQVLENSQRIRVLAGISPSQATYINLKMKNTSSSKAFGAAEAGAGLPGNYLASGNLIWLKGKLKSVSAIVANNAKPTELETLLEKAQFSESDRMVLQQKAMPQLNVGTSSLPQVSADWWQLNQSVGLATQQLLKVNKDFNHRFGVNIINHETEFAQQNTTLFKLPTDTFAYNELLTNKANDIRLAADYRLEVNKRSYFFLLQGSAVRVQQKIRANLQDDFSAFQQELKRPEHYFQVELSSTMKTGDFSLLKLSSSLLYQQLKENNTIGIKGSALPAHPIFTDDSVVEQAINQRPLQIGLKTDWLTLGWANIGPSVFYRYHRLNWQHSSVGNNGNVVLFGSAMQQWHDAGAGLVASKVWAFNGFAEIRIDYHHHSAGLNSADSVRRRLEVTQQYFQLSTVVNQTLGKEGRISVTARFRPGFTGEAPIFFKPFLSSYRDLRFDSLLFAFNTSGFAKLQYDFRKSLKLFFGSIGLWYGKKIADGADQLTIRNRLTVFGLAPISLGATNWRINTRLSKFWFLLKIRFETNFVFTQNNEERVQNASKNNWKTNDSYWNVVVEKSMAEQLTLRLMGNLNWGAVMGSGETSASTKATYQTTGLSANAAYTQGKWRIVAEVEAGKNKQNKATILRYAICNMQAAFKPTDERWELFAEGINLTGAGQFVRASNTAFAQQAIITSLRPRQIVLGGRFIF
jgi:hypothetical protein